MQLLEPGGCGESVFAGLPEPLVRRYRGWEVWTMPPSSAGGIGLLQILGMLEGTPFAQDGPMSSVFLHYCSEAMRRAFADRAAIIGDPAFVRVPSELLSEEHLDHLRQSIKLDRATPSSAFGMGVTVEESPCTTHLSILDCEGNSVALTFTLAGRYGSGVTVQGLGILLNNNTGNFAARPARPNLYGVVEGEANSIAGGKRPVSSMAPTILCRGGRAEGPRRADQVRNGDLHRLHSADRRGGLFVARKGQRNAREYFMGANKLPWYVVGPPVIVGIGLGGTSDVASGLAKRASSFRKIGTVNPDPDVAKLEKELLEEINNTGVGPQGLGGATTALAVHIEWAHTHISQNPVAVNLQCWRGERADAVITASGEVRQAEHEDVLTNP